MKKPGKIDEQKAAIEADRKIRREAAAHLWGDGAPPGPVTALLIARTRQRTAMVIAAFLLEAGGAPDDRRELADCLLCARPEYARQIATGVAACALRDGHSAVWDALAAVEAMDIERAGELFEAENLIWNPQEHWLVSKDGQR